MRYSEKILARFLIRMVSHQRDRDLFVQLFPYAYYMQVYNLTNIKPFNLVLTKTPPDQLPFWNLSAFRTDSYNKKCASPTDAATCTH